MEIQSHLPEANTTDQSTQFRPLGHFPPTIWGSSFSSFSLAESEFEWHNKQIEVLKEKVKEKLTASATDAIKNVEFINLLSRLGVSYHFETEIQEQLGHVFDILPNIFDNNEYGHDLYTVALVFCVLRQHGFKAPCNVFDKFTDKNGKWKKTIVNDVRGLLCLYEASYLSVHGEDILDEALAFTKANLEALAKQYSNSRLVKHIENVLTLPSRKNLPRLEALRYISFYQDDESCDETLLKFAKIDFNRLQLLHKHELSIVSRWWKEMNLAEHLPYARDRIAEVYLWACGAQFEPDYTFCRILTTKYIKLISLVDDTYDAYGTLDELQRFTQAFERCNIAAIDQLPDYMKVLYKVLLNLFEESENAVSEKRRTFSVSSTIEEFKRTVRSYYQEAQWFNSGSIPTVQEYIHNGLDTSTYGVIPAAFFLGMEKFAGVNEYEWLSGNPKMVEASKKICRLVDDIMTHKHEQERGHCASSVECYMNEFGVSEEKAKEEIYKICHSAWKDMNEECMKQSCIPKPILQVMLNLARVIEVVYQYNDAYTYAVCLKDYITSLFVDPLPL